MSAVKDPFEILADEITLIRRQIDQLQRTSLDRKEAEKLNAVMAQGLDRMAKVGPAVQTASSRAWPPPPSICASTPSTRPRKGSRRPFARRRWKASRQRGSSQGRRRGPQRGLEVVWRVLGVARLCRGHQARSGRSAMFWCQGRARRQGLREISTRLLHRGRGQIATNSDGSRFCGIWIDPPPQAN